MKNHLLFREALLQDPIPVMQYATLKERLTGRNVRNTESLYTRKKTEFVLDILR